MKIRLMDENGVWNPDQKLPFGAAENESDLELAPVLAEMSQGDGVIHASVRAALLSPLVQADQILYRQQVLSDCLGNSDAVRGLYELTRSALDKQESPSLCFSELQSVSSQFDRCLSRLTYLISALHSLRDFAQSMEGNFGSKGFRSLFLNLKNNLDDCLFAGTDELLEQLRFPEGMLIGAQLTGSGGSFGHELLRMDLREFHAQKNTAFYEVAQDDLQGLSDLLHRREFAMSDSNRILVRAISFICDYLRTLANNLAFYVGCLNLYKNLAVRKIPVCMPTISNLGYSWLAAGLTELNVGLKGDHPVANDLKSKNCCVITGADLGGKTTFLRSLGQGQLMMQCGMFAAAGSFSAPVTAGVYTHFQREEDRELRDGKQGEELNRMSGIVDHICPGALLLCDESFCSTNEREGSELAWQITQALREKGIAAFAVTHLFAFAQRLYEQCRNDCAFLCSERLPDGMRTKRILPGVPQKTSFSEDLYQEVFHQPASQN